MENQQKTIGVVDSNGDKLIFQCPNCLDFVIVFKSDLNCKIFRHAVYKNNHQQINPHTPEPVCKQLFSLGKVFGCAKPFKIIQISDNTYEVQSCEYI